MVVPMTFGATQRRSTFSTAEAMARPTDRPIVYMLCGFVGSGKTTSSRALEAGGCTRLSIDELVFERRGRHGIDYDESEYPDHCAPWL